MKKIELTRKFIQTLCTKAKLRPKYITIDGNMINLYWDETYFDTIDPAKIKELGKIIMKTFTKATNWIAQRQMIGMSDGHYYFFLNKNLNTID